MAPTEQYLGGPSLVSFFDGTGNIAVADVSSPRALLYDDDGSTIPCGFAYTASVIESLSGDEAKFEFVIPSYQEQVVPPGRYLVFTGFFTSSTPPRSGLDECLERVDYYTRAETESLFRIVPGTDDRKFRGPTQEDNMIEVVEIGACDLDDHGWIFCIDDVRKAVREIQSN